MQEIKMKQTSSPANQDQKDFQQKSCQSDARANIVCRLNFKILIIIIPEDAKAEQLKDADDSQQRT